MAPDIIRVAAISCVYFGLQVKWFKDDEELAPNDQIKMRIKRGKDPHTATLTLKNLEKSDEATYQMLVVNHLGEDRACVRVQVTEKPGEHM